MRISDWSSDVCSSDLLQPPRPLFGAALDADLLAAGLDAGARPCPFYVDDFAADDADTRDGRAQRADGVRAVHRAGQPVGGGGAGARRRTAARVARARRRLSALRLLPPLCDIGRAHV